MSRRKRGRFQGKKWLTSLYGKPKSKVDKALSIANRNKKRLSSVVETVSGGPDLESDAFNATPVVALLDLAGDGLKTRITSAQVRGTIKQNLTSVVTDDYRVDLVLDREPNGTIFSPLLCYGSATPPIGAYKALNYKKRYKILRSQFGSFNETGTTHADINWYVKLNLLAETKTVNSWTQANLIKNAIYLVYWTTASANQPIPALNVRAVCMDSNA